MNMIPQFALIDSDHGVSADAESLRKLFSQEEMAGQSFALGRPLWDLKEVFYEASRENWDGYGARAVSVAAYLAALDFLAAFTPGQSARPEISASPSGEIMLEWSAGPRHVFTLAFGGLGEKYYAGLFGSNKMTGREDLLERIVVVAEENLARLRSAAVVRRSVDPSV
jgi:hypothetical protein